MRKRTLIKFYPELEEYPDALDIVQECVIGLSDKSILLQKARKKKLDRTVRETIKDCNKALEEDFWNSQLYVVRRWAERKGISFSVKKRGENEYCESTKSIEINASLRAETQFYYAIHECGHLILSESKNYLKRYPFGDYDRFDCDHLIDSARVEKDAETLREQKLAGYAEQTKKKKKKKRAKKLYLQPTGFCILKLQEEMEAWDKGEALAKRFGLIINNKNYAKNKFRCLETYLDWAVLERSP